MFINHLKQEPTFSFLTRFERSDMPKWPKIGYSMTAFLMLIGAKVNRIEIPSGIGYAQEESFFSTNDLYYCFLNICWSTVLAKALSYSPLSTRNVVIASIGLPWIIGLIILQFTENQQEMNSALEKLIEDYFQIEQKYKRNASLDPMKKKSPAFELAAIQNEEDQDVREWALQQCGNQTTLFQSLFLLKHKQDAAHLQGALEKDFIIHPKPKDWNFNFVAIFVIENHRFLTNKGEIKTFLKQFPKTSVFKTAITYLGGG